MTKGIIKQLVFLFTAGIFLATKGIGLGQTFDHQDDYIDLWENERQLDDEYYIPQQDYPGSVPYITEEEIRALKMQDIEPEPEVIVEEVIEEKPVKPKIDGDYLAAFYLSNVTYGIATGTLIGGIASILENRSVRQNLSYIGIGVVLGGLFGFAIASYYDPKKALEAGLSSTIKDNQIPIFVYQKNF